MAVRHDELMRPVLSEAYRQHLITGLSPNMMVFDEWYRDDSTDAIRYNIDYEQAVRAPTQLTPKEPKMNEMMQALEAMIRRVVTEELSAKQLTVPDYTADAFARSLKNYVDTCGPEWTAVVSQGALDQPWFDNAVKAEVANTVEEGAFTFATKDAFDQYVKAMVEPITGGTAQNGGYSFRDEDSFVYAVTQIVQDDHLSGTFERAVRDIVLADSAVHDHIVEIVEATGSDNIRSRVESVIEDYDFSSIVAGVVGDMSFSVSVD